jgi:RHS repeat-associated protein
LWLGPEVDVYYMRHRWYETGTGRFLSEDPIGLAGGYNPVVFAGDNPVSGSDPTGLLPEAAFWYYFPWPFSVGPSVVPPWVPSSPGRQQELTKGRGWGGGGGGGGRGKGTPRLGWQEDPAKCAVAAGLALISLVPGAKAGGKVFGAALDALPREFTGILGSLARFQPRGLVAAGSGIGAWGGALKAPWADAPDLEFHKALGQMSAGVSVGLVDSAADVILDLLPVVGAFRSGIDAYKACF